MDHPRYFEQLVSEVRFVSFWESALILGDSNFVVGLEFC